MRHWSTLAWCRPGAPPQMVHSRLRASCYCRLVGVSTARCAFRPPIVTWSRCSAERVRLRTARAATPLGTSTSAAPAVPMRVPSCPPATPRAYHGSCGRRTSCRSCRLMASPREHRPSPVERGPKARLPNKHAQYNEYVTIYKKISRFEAADVTARSPASTFWRRVQLLLGGNRSRR